MATARADPAAYVFVPYAAAGGRDIAWAAGRVAGRDGTRAVQQVLSLGASPLPRWYTSLYVAWAAADGAPWTVDETSWLNHWQLSPPGAAPADLGLLCELARPHERSEGTGLTCGPTLQVDTERLQLNFNALVAKRFGAQERADATLGYQWQAKTLVAAGLELGAQGLGDVGPWRHWLPAGGQSHALGPALFKKWRFAQQRTLALDGAWLVGLGAGSPRDVLRLRLRQEF